MKIKLYLLLALIALGCRAFAQKGFPFDDEIRVFKHQDSLHFPTPNGILFIGSSSIRKWTDLEQRFAGQSVIKRGVGGSELSQWVKYYTPYVLFPYKPAKIFVYAGENDIAANRTAQQVQSDFIQLWTMIRKQLPKAEIYFMSIKMSPVRAKYYNEVQLADNLIKSYLSGKPHSHYIDVNTALFKEHTTMPDSSLFNNDYLHLNSKGYDHWEKVLKPYVK